MNYLKALILIFLAPILLSSAIFAQSTGFTYQGSLENGGNAATGNFDFEFVLFDLLAGGAQLGQTLTMNNVVVTNGAFSVRLDFGNQFSGANRFLEIRVRPAGQPGITTLSPRQMISSAPYSVKSLTSENANSVGGQTAASVANAALAVNSATQANIPNTIVMRDANGDFSAHTIMAAQQYNIGVDRVLSINGSNNIFVGVTAGLSNTTGSNNSFFGNSAGRNNTEGTFNSFFGRDAGRDNTTGEGNSFFGNGSGRANTTGRSNSFFGNSVGQSNTTGEANAFFGAGAGLANTTGFSNSFFGRSAGDSNTTGNSNSFFGFQAGQSNSTGNQNAFFGSLAGTANTTGFNNSFFGRNAGDSNTTGFVNSFYGSDAGQANTTGAGNSFFGSVAGESNTTGFNNSFFGQNCGVENTTGSNNTFAGTSAGSANTTGHNNAFFGVRAGDSNTSGLDNSFFGESAGAANTTGDKNTFIGRFAGDFNTTGNNNTLIGDDADVLFLNLSFATALGAGATVSTSDTVVLGRSADIVRIPGFLRVVQLGSPGSTPLCQNANDTISTCSSSIRYKSNINPFRPGLSLIKRLRPVSFNWKDGGMLDMGLVAEEVAEVEPLLVTTNKKGEIEGVKYDRVGVVLVNAVNEQQATIEAQQKQIDEQTQLIKAQSEKLAIAERELHLQRSEVEALKNLVCSQNPTAEICKPKE